MWKNALRLRYMNRASPFSTVWDVDPKWRLMNPKTPENSRWLGHRRHHEPAPTRHYLTYANTQNILVTVLRNYSIAALQPKEGTRRRTVKISIRVTRDGREATVYRGIYDQV